MRIQKLLFLLLFLKIFSCFSQEKKARYQNISDLNLNFHLLDVSSGLSHNFVNDIAQDSLGFIWVATYDGLNRYDGKNFLQFKKHLERPMEGLANNYVQELEMLADRILIATDAGVSIYNLRTGKFDLIDKEAGLFNNSVSTIEKLSSQYILIGSYRGGVQIADESHNIKTISEFLKSKKMLASKEISSAAVLGDSVLYIGSFDNGFSRVSLKTGDIIPSSVIPGLKMPSPVVNNLYFDSNQNLWIGTRNGLVVIKSNGEFKYLSQSGSSLTGLSDDEILCFQEDQCGQMWIGTRNGGLNILDISEFLRNDHLNIHWYLPLNDGSSVYNRTVSTIFQDRENNMWLGTPTGVNFVNPSGEKVQKLTYQNSIQNSLSHNRIGSVTAASGNMVWIGTDGGGLDLLDPEKGKIRHYQHQKGVSNSISNDYLLSLYEQSPDSLWIGTYQGGLNLLNPETGKVKHYLQVSTSEGSDVRTIFESSEGKLWIGTNRGGLYYYIPKNDQFRYVKELGKIDIRDIAEDKNGNLWLATYGSGIICYNSKKKIFQSYDQANLEGLKSDVVFSILVLQNGDILAGTRYGGLLRFNPETKVSKSFTEVDGLSNNTINSLIIEDSSYVWMGSYNGLNRYNIHTNEILNISSLDNIQEGEFNIGAAVRNREGLLFFGGNNGLNYFNPDDFKIKEKHSPLVFEGLKVLNKEVDVTNETKKTILKETLFFQDEIKLGHDENSFSIDFAALKYPEAKNINYSYKLENYNEFWIDNQTSGTANFTSVPPGNYNFLVKTNTGFGEESLKKLKVTIIPPFWKTIPAYLLYVGVIVIIILIGSRYYSERLILKNSLLFEKKQRSLEQNLNEERFRFFTAFSHELKTPLTLILAPVENLLSKKMSKENRKDLIFIQRNANNLFQSINKLLEFRKSEEGLSQLKKQPVNLPSLLQKLVKNYIPLAIDKNIKIEVLGPLKPQIFMIDLEKIEVIINNLLSNAIKYSEKGGEVKLIFSSDVEGFMISVQDSGLGIETADLSHIFEWYYRSASTIKKSGTGIGLALSKRFAELHGGTIEVKSCENTGTLFTLKIPIVASKNSNIEDISVEKKEKTEIKIESFQGREGSVNAEKDRKLVLIIDDNEEILNFLDRIFKVDYDVLYARNGKEGIKNAKKYVPDIIISDVMMPEKTGIDLCSELKNHKNTSHIPIILLTAKTEVESINVGYEEGADDYITKPFNTKLLKTRVHNILQSRENLKAYFQHNTSNLAEEEHQDGIINREKDFLYELDNIILLHIGKNSHSVEKIAKDIGMSRTSLYRKLKAITGFSINEYIRNLKLERAVVLIEDEHYSVSQASYEVGFNDVKYFRKIFKEKTGKNPSELKS